MAPILLALDSTDDFGAALRHHREAARRSLRELADATKLGVRTLEALERNHVEKLPPGIFRRAVVRAYAREVGLDPEDTLRVFLARHPDDLPPPGGAVGPVADADTASGTAVAADARVPGGGGGAGADAGRAGAGPGGAARRARDRPGHPPRADRRAEIPGHLMDAGIRTPLIEAFRRPDVPRDVRLDAAQGEVAPRGVEQLALLMLLADDDDAEVRGAADQTLGSLPAPAVAAALARSEVTAEMLRFFGARGIAPAGAPPETDAPLTGGDAEDGDALEATADADETSQDVEQSVTQQIQQMTVIQRVRAAMKGSREMRAILVRDPNKLVASAVLSSPKLSMSEVETFAKMANVTEDVLRSIAQNRAWVKNYAVAHGLARNPKTPGRPVAQPAAPPGRA